MLVACQLFYLQLLSYLKSRECAALFFIVILALFIELCKTVKLHGIAVCLEQTLAAGDVYRLCVKQGILHLACHKALPDKLV